MKVFLLFIFLLFFFQLEGQTSVKVRYEGENFGAIKKNPTTFFKDSISFQMYQRDLIQLARRKGYALASIDKIQTLKDTTLIRLYLGKRFEEVLLTVEEGDRSVVSKAISQREKILLNLPITSAGFAASMEQIEKAFLNDGFPFSKISIHMDSVQGERLYAKLDCEKGQRYTWKVVNVKGDSTVRSALLQNLLDIHEGEAYNESLFQDISKKIQQINYLQEMKPAELLFTPEGVELYLYVKSLPLSSLNGFVGLQPTPDNSGYKLAGDIQLKLLNVFHKGESFDLHWRNLQGVTQQFNTQLNLPYLFKTPFGIDGKFYLYKRDSSFLDVQSRVAIEYAFTGNTKAAFFYQRKSSNVLAAGINSATYSNLANVSSNNYGLGFFKSAVDYIPNPTRGYVISLSGSVGQRNTRVSDTIPIQQTLQINAESSVEIYVPIAKRNVLYLGNKSWSLNTDPLYQNELLRFGGLLWQRGFNEDDFFGSTVSTTSLEYRFLFDQDSRVFVFGDLTWYENNAITYTKDVPYGFGAGFAFGTEIGTFSLVYAIGSQRNNPVLIQNGRIHFGYIAYF